LLGMELPQQDLTRHFQSCAVVGNSMNLFRTANGAAIDRHDAVMRFNNEWERMQHVMREAGTLRADTQARHLGFNTTFRLLNRKYTNQVGLATHGVHLRERGGHAARVKDHFDGESPPR
jgi:hypothetical protein